MAEYILPNGVTLYTRVNEFIQHVAGLEVNAQAAELYRRFSSAGESLD